MSCCLVALGSNLGDRQATLLRALTSLADHAAVRLTATSRFYETPPVGGPAGQSPFLNAAARLETTLAPEALLRLLHEIEERLGRDRRVRWQARTLDLDLLLFDREIRKKRELTLPHPRMAWRRFVLEPAAEIAADMPHPTSGWTVGRLWDHLQTARNYVALTGPAGRAAMLAHELALRWDGACISASWSVSHGGAPLGHSPLRIGDALLEYQQRCADHLRADLPLWSAPLVTSDFWFDDARALAEAMVPSEARTRLIEQWESLAQRVVRPKLVAVLHLPGDEPSPDPPGPRDQAASRGEAIRRWAAQPGRGPVLAAAELIDPGLRGDAMESAVRAELEAAVEAMR